MVFSSQVKAELARVLPLDTCCQRAELLGLIRSAGTLRLTHGEGLVLQLASENAAAARKAFLLLKKLFRFHPSFTVMQRRRLQKNYVYFLEITSAEVVNQILHEVGLLGEDGELCEGALAGIKKRRCCRMAYLRGAFLARGSIMDPEKGYHLEILTDRREHAEELVGLLRGLGLEGKVMERKKDQVVYVKEADQIASLLAMMGAHTSVLAWENVRVMKQVRNQVNRVVNCETANLEKTISAAMRQLEEIRFLDQVVGLDKLPPRLREVAKLRLAYPEASLQEIGEMTSPRLGKAGVHHRMQRLMGLAASYRQKMAEGDRILPPRGNI